MSDISQAINELLASGATPQGSLKNEIKNAEKYLKLEKEKKPDWFDEFLTSNKNKLTETILRAISSQDGISSLSGYNEGYFNEIIQNANDLHAGECIDITVNKDGTAYSVKCSYQDKGFTLSNIYGFLNREMSDKSSDEGQTGKFGVGIKSFFKFVSKFRIESNIIIDITIDRENSAVDSQVSVNDRWDKKNTFLSFEYDEEEAKNSGFNIKKLSKLITMLDEESNDTNDKAIRRFFMTGEDQEIVFDIRSMIFMNKDPNKATIRKLHYSGRSHSITVECHDFCEVQKIEVNEEKWYIRNIGLDISFDHLEHNHYDYEYVILNHGKITIGIPLYVEKEKADNNRFYSTYYIKTDAAPEFLPTGMIIDSHFANIHRNDLGNSEPSIKDAYQRIRDFMLKAFQCMSSKEIASVEYPEDISYAFHHLLYLYLDEDINKYQESPFTISGLDNQYLPKISGDTKTDIVVHKSEENYQKSSYLDQDSVSALTDFYFDYIERENVIDFRELIESDECICAVSQIYQKISSSDNSGNYQTAREILHYFPSVGDYITYRISGEIREKAEISDHEIDYWINALKKEMRENFNLGLCLKLIGRYNLNAAIAYNGSLLKENLSFKDYLFNGIPELENGVLSNWQNEQYDSMYSGLKQQLRNNQLYDAGNLQNKYLIRFIEPRSYSRRKWNNKYDCYGLPNYIIDSFVSDTNKFLLLKKIATNSNLLSNISNDFLYLFERMVIDWEYRDKRPYNGKPFEYCYPDYKQQIIRLEFLKNIVLNDYGKFLEAIQYRKNIRDAGRYCPISISCHQSLLSTHDIENAFLPQLVMLDENTRKTYLLSEYSSNDVIVERIKENTNNELPQENRDFVIKLTGYHIHVSRFDSNSKKYVIAYFGNRSAKIKMEASAAFTPIATYLSRSKDIYIFYDNVPDINSVVSTVLKELKLPKNLMEFLLGYIHNGNDTKTLNYLSRRRTFARVRKRLILDWTDISTDEVSGIEDTEVLYRLLTARGSYDIYCPICSDIPLETFDYGEDTKKKHSRRIVVMENENPDTRIEYPYIITVSCSYCFEKLRHTLSKSEFDGKRLTLTTHIAQGLHEKMKSRNQIELSPVNIVLMRNIKIGNNHENTTTQKETKVNPSLISSSNFLESDWLLDFLSK